MIRISLAALTVALLAGNAMAQTTESTTTTTTTTVPPPIVSTSDKEVTTKTYPFSNIVTTTEKSTDTSNGVATHSESTVNAYPPGATIPPVGTSSTTTIQTK